MNFRYTSDNINSTTMRTTTEDTRRDTLALVFTYNDNLKIICITN